MALAARTWEHYTDLVTSCWALALLLAMGSTASRAASLVRSPLTPILAPLDPVMSAYRGAALTTSLERTAVPALSRANLAKISILGGAAPEVKAVPLAPGADPRTVLQVFERVLSGIPKKDLSNTAGLANAAWSLWDGLRTASPDGTPPVFSDPLAGIGLFRQVDAEPRKWFQDGARGRPGYRKGQYWPRTGEYHYEEYDARAKDNGSVRSWTFKARHGFPRIQPGFGLCSDQNPETCEDWDLMRADMKTLARRLNIKAVDPQSRLGYPGVAQALSRMRARPSDDIETLRPGELVFLEDSSGSESLFRVGRVEKIEDREPFYRLYAGEPLDSGGTDKLEFRTDIRKRRFISGDSADSDGFIASANSSARLWRVGEGERQTFLRYLPRIADPTYDAPDKRAGLVLQLALFSMAYERWGVDEISAISAGARKKKLLKGRYARVTPANYARALDVLLARFGEEELYRTSAFVLDNDLKRLHTSLHTPGLPFGAHTDIGPLGPLYTRLASEAILGAHPVPKNMSESGYLVNAKSLVGDYDFWEHLAKSRRPLFDRLVDHLLSLPREYPQRSLYARAAVLDPIAVIKRHFQRTFALIHGLRPEFDSPTVEPIRLTSG